MSVCCVYVVCVCGMYFLTHAWTCSTLRTETFHPIRFKASHPSTHWFQLNRREWYSSRTDYLMVLKQDFAKKYCAQILFAHLNQKARHGLVAPEKSFTTFSTPRSLHVHCTRHLLYCSNYIFNTFSGRNLVSMHFVSPKSNSTTIFDSDFRVKRIRKSF